MELNTKEELYSFLDNYTAARRSEIDTHGLKQGTGLIKSYVLETSQHNGIPDIEDALSMSGITAQSINDDLFVIKRNLAPIGYAEPLTSRYFAIHSFEVNDDADQIIRRATKQSPKLDSLWLTSDVFQQLLKQYIEPQSPHRWINMRFEQRPRYEFGVTKEIDETTGEIIDIDTETESDVSNQYWGGFFSQRAEEWAATLHQYQEIQPRWNAIKMLRIPGSEQGGYDLWYWGKMTYRTSSFREGRALLKFVSTAYEKLTAAIEDAIWLEAEETHIGEQSFAHLRGLPAIFEFEHELSPRVFANFIESTFDGDHEPFRLWGNPIWLGENKVHVYGMDLHLWQPVYMEFTRKRFLFLLPTGTCGNTVHRLFSNIQRYIDPTVHLTIGGTNYGKMIENAIQGHEVFDER